VHSAPARRRIERRPRTIGRDYLAPDEGPPDRAFRQLGYPTAIPLASSASAAPRQRSTASFHAVFERERGARHLSDEESDRLADETDAAFRRIVRVTPITAAGLAAKASAALTRLLWQVAPVKDLPWRDQASAGEQAALECLAAVARRELP
jgi:hypothetical protein